MNGGFTIYKRMLKRRKQISDKLQRIEVRQKELPEGKLICSRVGQYYKWERSDGKNKTYIPKKDRSLAEKLAEKKYLSALQNDLNHEMYAIDLYLKQYSTYNSKVDQLLSESPEVEKLLSPCFSPLSKELEEWKKSPYETNPKNPEHLTHKVGTNEFVRSKSEAMIAKVLRQYNVPYKYEMKLEIDSISIYPDFTIRHPKTGDVYYWEHFGLLDKSDYVRNMHLKLQTFTSHNIMPGINLITTFENNETPLNFEMIEMMVSYYFL